MDNIKIAIADNGTTTLATAGKYCDRNVDIEVNVAGGGGGGNVEPIHLTGGISYYFYGPITGAYIDLYGNTISTENISYFQNLFQNNTATRIPFNINCDGTTTNTFANLFNHCLNLKELPRIINGKPTATNDMLSYCANLREIPDSFCDTWDWSTLEATTSNYQGSRQSLFSHCESLRKYSQALVSHYSPKSNYSMTYAYMFDSCYCLDAINDLPVVVGANPITSNQLNYVASNTYRLKSFTFALDNGNPVVANWQNQTIDLSGSTYSGVGYTTDGAFYIGQLINNNSGITADKEVKDDATYEALKNDPDWFSTKRDYSRYNHDSAVETINSLPDCSATGTNTIKFRGAAGAKTDGGAINTLTDAEIAVAAAKGWTVSLV